MRAIYPIVAALAVGGLTFAYLPTGGTPPESAPGETTALVDVILPESFSKNATIGQRGFEAKCAACHGVNAAGNSQAGPPLIHKIYEPGHHGDASFMRAAALGVRSHHWKFGDMPPVDGVTPADVKLILAYIRELQRANDIF